MTRRTAGPAPIPPLSSPHGVCPVPPHKACFPEHEVATAVREARTNRLMTDRAGHPEGKDRAYRCRVCAWWHLTSQPRWAGRAGRGV